MKLVVATRGSQLALFQAGFVRDILATKFPEHDWVLETIVTTGDKIHDKRLSDFGGKGVFLKEIEEALLQKRADLAVHSLKDVPGIETAGLQLSAFLPREDPRDVWASFDDDFAHIAPGKKVGTSSLRRSVALKFYRPDLEVELLRGNLDTRLRKLKDRQYDAIIVAAAGLHRLNFFDASYMHYLAEDAFVPAIGQGILTIQTRSENDPLISLVSQITDPDSEIAARMERRLLARYEGGCHLPIGALATKQDSAWRFRALIGGARSNRLIQDVIEDPEPDVCVTRLFANLDQLGAFELLQELND